MPAFTRPTTRASLSSAGDAPAKCLTVPIRRGAAFDSATPASSRNGADVKAVRVRAARLQARGFIWDQPRACLSGVGAPAFPRDGLDVDRVRALIDKGIINGTRIGRDRKVSMKELRAYKRREEAFMRKLGVTSTMVDVMRLAERR